MITRREFLADLSALAVCSAPMTKALALSKSGPKSGRASGGVSQYVNPMIGCGGHGHVFPGATVPFGMVQLSPDTGTNGWDWCSGYHYSDTSIMGFSHTHLSGTGGADLLDFLVMPGTGEAKLVAGPKENPEAGYRSRFSHDDEEARPGYYSVLLKDYNIHAELTATERVGMHRYTFPQSETSHFIVDLHHASDESANAVLWADVRVVGNDTIVGGRSTHRWADGREIYFAMKFSKPFAKVELVSDDKVVEGETQQLKGKNLKVLVHYRTTAGEKILAKMAISGVSVEGAQKNLDKEVPGWDFDGISKTAAKEWEKQLSRIKVEGGTRRQKEIFYTGLYHAYMAPTLFDDVDGQYRGMDGKVHQLDAGEHNYSTYSLWDTYRALHPLFTLVQYDRVPSLVNCLIRMSEESTVGMPMWPLHAKETFCMTGYHSADVIAEAITKKYPIDAKRAYSVIRKQAFESDRLGQGLYRKYKYIPADLEGESIGKGMDYAFNAWSAAHVAKAAGAPEDDVKALFEQATYYRNFYDKGTQFVRPRLASGEWAEPFAPNEMGHMKKWRDYTESNAWQATFAVQHDPEGLAQLLGGRKQLEEKLDALFNADPALPPDAPPDIAGIVGQYAHGNEPSHHIAYLYVYAGAAHKTQARVASLLETQYHNEPDGLAGNEDCGQMSAWYVMSAMGFYAVDPTSGNYVIGSPIFDRVTIDIGGGRTLRIDAKRKGASDQYVQSVAVNGQQQQRLWFSHESIAQGGVIDLAMSATPNTSLGSGQEDVPPSMSTGKTV